MRDAADPAIFEYVYMKPRKPPVSRDGSKKVPAQVKTLLKNGQALKESSAEHVDTIADRDGRSTWLRKTQEPLSQSEVAREAVLLNALPADIALIDTKGVLISVNDAWRQSADTNAIPGHMRVRAARLGSRPVLVRSRITLELWNGAPRIQKSKPHQLILDSSGLNPLSTNNLIRQDGRFIVTIL